MLVAGLAHLASLSPELQLDLLLDGGDSATLEEDVRYRLQPYLQAMTPQEAHTLLAHLLHRHLGYATLTPQC